MSLTAILASLAFVLGLGLLAAAVLVPRHRSGGQQRRRTLRESLPAVRPGEVQNLRLAGIEPESFVLQRFVAIIAGLFVGLVLSLLLGRGPVGMVVITGLTAAAGWLLPLLGVRDTAKRARAELDKIVRLWVVLVAQQVSAGVDPSTAMLTAARAGDRPHWRLLYRFLLAAQQERRQPWEGLVDLVDRYGVYSVTSVVSSLGLAAQRGTRISDAILNAADTLWKETMAAEREKAVRRAQIIVVPATGIALGLAGILVYPPFTSLTGGGIAGIN